MGVLPVVPDGARTERLYGDAPLCLVCTLPMRQGRGQIVKYHGHCRAQRHEVA